MQKESVLAYIKQYFEKVLKWVEAQGGFKSKKVILICLISNLLVVLILGSSSVRLLHLPQTQWLLAQKEPTWRACLPDWSRIGLGKTDGYQVLSTGLQCLTLRHQLGRARGNQ